MTPFAYVCAAIGGTVALMALCFVCACAFEHWQIGREIDADEDL